MAGEHTFEDLRNLLLFVVDEREVRLFAALSVKGTVILRGTVLVLEHSTDLGFLRKGMGRMALVGIAGNRVTS